MWKEHFGGEEEIQESKDRCECIHHNDIFLLKLRTSEMILHHPSTSNNRTNLMSIYPQQSSTSLMS